MSERSLKILLVEDDEDTRTALKSFMVSLGHEVSDVADVSHALADLQRTDYDLLLSDIGLPDGTGWELLQRAQRPKLFGVAMSGFGLNADRARSREAGFRHHLMKPFEPGALEGILQEAVQSVGMPT